MSEPTISEIVDAMVTISVTKTSDPKYLEVRLPKPRGQTESMIHFDVSPFAYIPPSSHLRRRNARPLTGPISTKETAMQITLTSTQEVLCQNEEFLADINTIEADLKRGRFSEGCCTNYDTHICIDVTIPEYLRPTITQMYEKLGWVLLFKYHDKVMFFLPKEGVTFLVDDLAAKFQNLVVESMQQRMRNGDYTPL